MRDHNVQLTTSAVGGDIALEQRARKRRAEQQAETSYMAQILDYIGQTADMYELHDNPRNWSDVEIMEMAAKRGRRPRSAQGFLERGTGSKHCYGGCASLPGERREGGARPCDPTAADDASA